MDPISAKMPWKDSMGDIPLHLSYFEGTIAEAVCRTAEQYPDRAAYEFIGKETVYSRMMQKIITCAAALQALGIQVGDAVTIAMPNCPQAVCMFYAVNLAGGVANMIHPLSAEREIAFYLKESASVAAVTLDQFAEKFASVRQETGLRHLIVARIQDELSPLKKAGYAMTAGRHARKTVLPPDALLWRDFIKLGNRHTFTDVPRKSEDPAVILYSGGTTGTTKGILLTNRNFNALGQQVIAANPMFIPGDRMLAAMPIFHGFGLGVCIHTMLSQGGCCVLVPRFTPKSYAKLLVCRRCAFIAGVPTIYEALLRLDTMAHVDFTFLKGVFSGGDSLSVELKKKLDEFLAAHHAPVSVREGYGTTETVTACCLTPPQRAKEGSIGIPFPDTYMKIVRPGSEEEVPYGEEGEILISGPTVMQGYLHHPEETAEVLRTHADGRTWVYTGDLGVMDEEGFLYFRGRAKRMIVSSGYNIYPAQLENILDAHPMVQMSCVIGVPDPHKMQRVKAFLVLKSGVPANEETRTAIFSHCRAHIARYALPSEIVFREELPKTLVGKVAYRVLEEEEKKRANPL